MFYSLPGRKFTGILMWLGLMVLAVVPALAQSSAPTITSFTPTSGPVGTSVYVMGTALTGATSVKFNGTAATISAINTEGTALATKVPTGATTGKISVTTYYGTATSTTDFIVTSTNTEPPTITSFTPTSGPVGTIVNVSGTNFTGITAVQFGSLAAQYSVNSVGTAISAKVPTGASTGNIYVLTSHGNCAGPYMFTVTVESTAPVISGFTPAQGSFGAAVYISGSRFTGATAVKFNGVAAKFTVSSDGLKIGTNVPVGATTGKITVTTPNGTATSATDFTVVPLPAPTISGFSPAAGPVDTLVVVKGTYFTGTTDVKFNGVSAPFVVDSAAQLTARVPANATTGLISVTTYSGTVNSSSSFTVTAAPAVKIVGFYPAAGGPGSSIAIFGGGFTGATAVRVGGVAVSSFTVNTEGTQISTAIPSAALTGAISVTTPAGAGESGALRYTVAPRVTGFVGDGGGAIGALVTLNGANFAGATLVKFNGVAASFTIVSTTQITAIVPAGATTGSVVVINPGGYGSSPTFTVK